MPNSEKLERTLRLLDAVQPLYMLPNDPFGEDVLIPGFEMAMTVDCMVGFFSSEVLASLAPGLATFIAQSDNSFRLIISPILREKDQLAIQEGFNSAKMVVDRIMGELTVTEDMLQRHTLKCLTWLLREGRIDIKVALMKDALFHPKVWLFENNNDVLAAHGSSNVTYAGISKNVEQIAISKSWQDPNQAYITKRLRDQFNLLWKDRDEYCIVIDLPSAVNQRLLRTYSSDTPPTEDELRTLYDRAVRRLKSKECLPIEHSAPLPFSIPIELEYKAGSFEHQQKAVVAWCESGFQGVLEMATGSGKTITSMIGAHRLYDIQRPIFITVAAPYIPLVAQWCDEIALFGLRPVNLTTVGGEKKRFRELQKLKRRLLTRLSDVEVVVVSHDTLCSPKFLAAIESFDCPRLLIADEAHNLGRPSFINAPPDFFEYRLGLSATPIRQYDEEGTAALLDYFGSVVFQFTLEQAIGRCLVEYDYYVHDVYLTPSEMDEWYDLTGKIKESSWRVEEDRPDEYTAMLLRERRALLETASGKIAKLDNLLKSEDVNELKHTLIYTSDKKPDQLNNVNQLLQDKNIMFHQLTAKETRDREDTKRIIKSFQDGEIQVLSAKRVLDEGVNIPQVNRAFILASTTIERQWVQRRGRLLRTCNAIGKTHSIIHDFLALPTRMGEDLDPDARKLVRSELHRVQEFARLARNAGRPNGPLATMDKMAVAAYLKP